jgi:hypothetical protein
MTARSYSDLSDSATTFDPEEQLDRDIDERMKGMSKEEALGEYIDKLFAGYGVAVRKVTDEVIPGEPFISISEAKKLVCAAVAAANKWDAEHPSNGECALCGGPLPCLTHIQFPKQDKPPHLLDMRGAFKGGGDPPFKAGDVFGNSDGK